MRQKWINSGLLHNQLSLILWGGSIESPSKHSTQTFRGGLNCITSSGYTGNPLLRIGGQIFENHLHGKANSVPRKTITHYPSPWTCLHEKVPQVTYWHMESKEYLRMQELLKDCLPHASFIGHHFVFTEYYLSTQMWAYRQESSLSVSHQRHSIMGTGIVHTVTKTINWHLSRIQIFIDCMCIERFCHYMLM